MTWICLVLVLCSKDGKDCSVERSTCGQVTVEAEAAKHKACEAASNCVEPKRGIYLIREDRPEAKPAGTATKL